VVGPFPRCAGLRSSCASVTRSAGNLERYFLSINELNVLRVLPTVGRVKSNPDTDWYKNENACDALIIKTLENNAARSKQKRMESEEKIRRFPADPEVRCAAPTIHQCCTNGYDGACSGSTPAA
jgi:hypothetical protein